MCGSSRFSEWKQRPWGLHNENWGSGCDQTLGKASYVAEILVPSRGSEIIYVFCPGVE
jgi:hypothetical protein